MSNREKPDDGMTADEAAEHGIGRDIPTSSTDNVASGIVPNPMAPGVIAPVGGELDDVGINVGSDLPDEVNPEYSGMSSGSDTDSSRNLVRKYLP